jgi:ABC-2 type transport system ATP-binding protein
MVVRQEGTVDVPLPALDAHDGPAIEVRGLTRAFEGVPALAGVDMEVPRGAVFGLLGPNGAGKTTTVRILNGVLDPTGVDTLRVLGLDLPAGADSVRPHVGVQTDTNLYERLTARDNLSIFARFYGLETVEAGRRADELLDMFGLFPRAKERVKRFSKGMKQKMLIARALVGSPQLVYLDEPTAGLDPEATHELMSYIRTVSQAEQTTFFITSHRLDEMESVCTKVAVLDCGVIRAQGSPAEVARAALPCVRVRVTPAPGVRLPAGALLGLPGAVRAEAGGGSITVEVSAAGLVPAFVRAAAGLPVDLLGVAEEPPTLQEAYLALVGTPADPPASAAGEVAR